MSYQSKTTVVNISVWNWSEDTECSIRSRFLAIHAVAVKIANQCGMDVMNISLHPVEGEAFATIVYVNNGCTLDYICQTMKPFINDKPQVYWMIQDIYKWQDLLDCIVAVRGTDETWD
jgi:hypothetical protein